MLRLGHLPEVWIVPPATPGVAGAGSVSGQAGRAARGAEGPGARRAGQRGVRVPVADMFGVAGQRLLNEVPLGPAYAIRMELLHDLIELHHRRSPWFDREVRAGLEAHPGWWAPIQARRQAGAGGGVRGRGRRRRPVPHRPPPLLVCRADPPPLRVRHHRCARPHIG